MQHRQVVLAERARVVATHEQGIPAVLVRHANFHLARTVIHSVCVELSVSLTLCRSAMIRGQQVIGSDTSESVVTELCRNVEGAHGIIVDGPAAEFLDAYEALGTTRGPDAPAKSQDTVRALAAACDWPQVLRYLEAWPEEATHFHRMALDAVHDTAASLHELVMVLAIIFRRCEPRQVWGTREQRYAPLLLTSALFDNPALGTVPVTALFVLCAQLLDSLGDDIGAHDGALKLIGHYFFERSQGQHVPAEHRDKCLVAGCVLLELQLLGAFDAAIDPENAADAVVGHSGVTRVLELYAVQVAAATRIPRLVRTVGVALCYDAIRLTNGHLVLGEVAAFAQQQRKATAPEHEDTYYATILDTFSARLSPPGSAPELWKEVALLFAREDAPELPPALTAYVAHAAALLACAYPAPSVDGLMPRRLRDGPAPAAHADLSERIVSCVVAMRRGMAAVADAFASVAPRIPEPHRTIAEPVTTLLACAEPKIAAATQAVMRDSLFVSFSHYDIIQACISETGVPALRGITCFLSRYALAAAALPTAAQLAKNTVHLLDNVLQVLFDRNVGFALPHVSHDALRPGESLWPCIGSIWSHMCMAIMLTFRSVPTWSRTTNKYELLEWLPYVPKVASYAVRSTEVVVRCLREGGAPEELCTRVTEQLAHSVDGAIEWIRLNDRELVQQLYGYLRRTVAEFLRRGMAMPGSVVEHALNFVRTQLAIKNATQRKTLLSTTQLEVLEEEFVAVRRAAPRRASSAMPPAARKERLLQTRLSFGTARDVIDVDAIPDSPKRGIPPAPPIKNQAGGFGKPQPKSPPAAAAAPGPPSKLAQLRSEFQANRNMARRPVAPKRAHEPDEPAGPLAANSLAFSVKLPPSRTVARRKEEEKEEESSSTSSSSSDDEEGGGARGIGALQSPRKRRVPVLRQEKRQRVRMMDDGTTQQMLERAEHARRRERLRMEPSYNPLHRCILDWTFDTAAPTVFLDGQPPSTIKHVPPTFANAAEYARVFGPMLVLECWAQYQQAKEEYTGAPALPLAYIKRNTIDSFDRITFDIPTQRPKSEILLTDNDIVVVENGMTRILAKVDTVDALPSSMCITLRFYLPTRKYLVDQLCSMRGWTLGKLFSLTTLHREYAALESIEDIDLRNDVLAARVTPKPPVVRPDVVQAMRRFGLNEPQAAAIVSALRTPGFSLIQGPPGTGKTKTIRALVNALVSRRGTSMSSTRKGPRMLLCAPSNAAVDELVVRVRESCVIDGRTVSPRVLRLGREDMVSPAVRDLTLDAAVRRQREDNESAPQIRNKLSRCQMEWSQKGAAMEAMRTDPATARKLQREQDQISDMIMDLEVRLQRAEEEEVLGGGALGGELPSYSVMRMNLLNEAEVICTTLGGAGQRMLYNLEFDMIIIDEAAQAVELSTLIPLRYACTQCVMVGDPKQLPPTVISQKGDALGYSQSMFVRMFTQCPERVHLLSIQYRMHPDISVFPSSAFYQSQLIDGEGMAKVTTQPWHAFEAFGPFRFFDLPDAREQTAALHSVSNQAEASAAVALYEALQAASSQPLAGRVGFVSMYKSQVKLLRQVFVARFGSENADAAVFNTVDGFQGQEKDVIILSCVRSNAGGNIGFLKDERRLNVALTRAKSSLFIIGNAKMLAHANQTWSHLIRTAESMQCLTQFSHAALRARRRVTPEMLSAREKAKVSLPKKETTEPKRKGNEAGQHEDVKRQASAKPQGTSTPAPPQKGPDQSPQSRPPQPRPPQPRPPQPRPQQPTPVRPPDPAPPPQARAPGKWTQKLQAARSRANNPNRATPIAAPRTPAPVRPPTSIRPPTQAQPPAQPSWLRSSRPSGIQPKK